MESEEQVRATEAAQAAEEAWREQHRQADGLIRALYTGKKAWSARDAAHTAKRQAVFATLRERAGARDAWQRLLACLGHDSPLMTIEPVVAALGPQPGNTGLDALLLLAMQHARWLSAPETLRPSDVDVQAAPPALAVFAPLVRHLLGFYDVPLFLDAAWFAGFTPWGTIQRDWWTGIADGHNVRSLPGPIALTSRAAHCFLQAPADSTVVAALRRGQILALGGSESLARAIAESKMGELLPDEPFWASVIHFFVNHPDLPLWQIGPLVDYLWAQRFGVGTRQDAAGRWLLGDGPEADLSMKGRTPAALLARMAEWHERLAKDDKKTRTTWEPSGYAPLDCEERDEFGTWNHWTIVELCDSATLQEEGREMRHCVRSYDSACVQGKTAIWSLRVRSLGEKRVTRLLTLEINLQRRAIVQARGRCNQSLGAMGHRGRRKSAGEIVRRWARAQHVGIACAL